MENTVQICNYIKEQRELAGMSIADVAEASGVSESTINNLSANKIPTPGFWTIANIVKAIGGSLDEMAGIPRPSTEVYEKQISDLDTKLKAAERDNMHMQATSSGLQRLLDERAASIHWLRRAIIIVSCISLALLIFVFSVLIYDIRHPSKGYFTDEAGNVYPSSTGEIGHQDQPLEGNTIITSFDYSINEYKIPQSQ